MAASVTAGRSPGFLSFLTLCVIHCVMLPGMTGVPVMEQSHFDIICSNILNLDCAIFRRNPSTANCGTDGVTYNNSCQFAQRHCRAPNLHVLHAGACVPGSASGGAPAVAGLKVVLGLVCDDVVHLDCTGQPAVVMCASDGRTYDNSCVFEKARCGQYGLHVVHAGAC